MSSKRLKKTPRDNASLVGLFGEDFLMPVEGEVFRGTRNVIRTAQRIVTMSGVSDLMTAWRRQDRAHLRHEGPTPWLNETQLVTLMLWLALSRRPVLVTEMRKFLLGADKELMEMLGITVDPEVSRVAVYHRAYRTYRRVVALMNPEPESVYRRLTPFEYNELVARRDKVACAARRVRAHTFANALLYGSWMLLPRDTRRSYKGDVAVDATAVISPAPGRASHARVGADGAIVPPLLSSDPGAGWYRREGNHDGSSTSRAKTMYNRTKDVLAWAREATTCVSYGEGVPKIILAMSLDNPGKHVAQNALICLDALVDRGIPVGHFVADRAYLPGTKAHELAEPLRARGHKLVFDYPKDQLGQQASAHGALLIEGSWYCPSMPQALRDATKDYMHREMGDPERLSEAVYEERIAQREQYRLSPKERPDAEGFARLQCPAVGPYASVACPRREPHPASLDKPKGRVLLPLLVEPAPKVCEQQTITVAPSEGAKYRQEYPYKSTQWQKHFTEGRQSVESLNKSVKDGGFNPIDDPERRRRRGWAPQLIAIVVLIVATNTRKIIAWIEDRIDEAERPVTRARRRVLSAGRKLSSSADANAPPDSIAA